MNCEAGKRMSKQDLINPVSKGCRQVLSKEGNGLLSTIGKSITNLRKN